MNQTLRIYSDHKNRTCKNVYTGIVLRWRIIIEAYGLDIKYIKDENYIVADTLSILLLNGNQETTQESTYK